MRKSFFMVLSAITFSWLMLFSGCSSKNPSTGTLTVIVYDYMTNTVVPNELVYLATSYQNLRNHVWINSLYTDANGRVYFHDLTPIITYYDTEHWENYGATQVYAGIDETAILYVNNPLVSKK
ncbi:MAG: hypothetical protein NTW31_11730 [Bacteroidetes bacterium]|nr:hypothetical protein [Bacteroidota bacterium]